MIGLVFLACLATSSDECSEYQLVFYDITVTTCLAGAQTALAQWATHHPHHRIMNWKCQQLNLLAKRA